MQVTVTIDTSKPISFSAYDTFTQCAKRYELSRIVKVPEQPAMYFAGGSAVHIVTSIVDHLVQRGMSWDEAGAEADRLATDVGLEVVEEMFGLNLDALDNE